MSRENEELETKFCFPEAREQNIVEPEVAHSDAYLESHTSVGESVKNSADRLGGLLSPPALPAETEKHSVWPLCWLLGKPASSGPQDTSRSWGQLMAIHQNSKTSRSTWSQKTQICHNSISMCATNRSYFKRVALIVPWHGTFWWQRYQKVAPQMCWDGYSSSAWL